MKQRLFSVGTLGVLLMFITANLVLTHQAQLFGRDSDCLGGSGYGGIWDGPWQTEVWCSTQQDFCIEAECNCGSQSDWFADRSCIENLVCNGTCTPQ